jgi:hypothetical protein
MIAGIDDLDLFPGGVEAPLDLDEDAQPGAGDILEVLKIQDGALGDFPQEFLGFPGFPGDEHPLQVDDTRFVLPDFEHVAPLVGPWPVYFFMITQNFEMI